MATKSVSQLLADIIDTIDVTGRELTTGSNTRTLLNDFVNSFYNKVDDTGFVVGETVAATITQGSNTVAHTTGKTAQIVTFEDQSDPTITYDLDWEADGTTGITVTLNVNKTLNINAKIITY